MRALHEKSLKTFFIDGIRWNLQGTPAFQIFRLVLLGCMGLGIYAYSFQARYGLSVTGMNDIVSWGFYISNFTFLVGVAAAAVMLILPAYVFHDPDFHRVVIIGEGVAVGALIMCLTFILVDLGGPLQAWHLIPGIGLFNFPSSILAWDVVVLNGYLLLNALVPAYILYCHYMGRKADERKYRPFVFLSIFWAFSIHMVTAFLYQGLPARPFWNNPLMGPRFLASAFAAGPALITLILAIIHSSTTYKIDRSVFSKLRIIIVISAIINLIMLFSEIFKEFYFTTHHSISAVYLFFGLDGYDALVPWIWTSVCANVLATLVLALNPGKNNPKVLLPACGLLFIAIWMEKGIGLIVPGLIPSPLGEVVDYLPTWVELCVTLGILALGITVVTWLVRVALIIEQNENPLG
ncbi:sulfate reduction electron transfer complex DsrMKJOP subunit DsrP [Desulfosediminicola ganghwensis]|uniref:sulfate reduction electron transfer complex DsrMKJOP subunit DsrP n=1 Tax=Desulfosediminicola ganghwensis TaxID=2569540 RepID=UPI0010AD8438|nr:NrfD/PsrC family molybdoenzyme membrane anchor subunit [Desulfosediminicola ganghwensis]